MPPHSAAPLPAHQAGSGQPARVFAHEGANAPPAIASLPQLIPVTSALGPLVFLALLVNEDAANIRRVIRDGQIQQARANSH